MEDFIEKDQQLLLYLNNLGNKSFDPFWLLMSSKLVWIPLYIIFLYLLYKNYKLRNFIFILIFIGIGITISDQLCNIFKNGVLRLRPCHTAFLEAKMRLVTCGGQYGFYSSHASNSFFISAFLSSLIGKRYKYFTVFVFVWAIVVSYSRIYLGVHFPFDVAFGALIGFLLGGLFSVLAKKSFRTEKLKI
ncbi:phosphatase PAP2 family protein [Halpernia frigidisoli]|uniref:Undecaprenyl-diphosphatase n=1 Tax=Halpernia frigidisoli TaxID=1125876 RepID=A0A1I3F5F7_9FLAO|nr:phosphatase PAP2 family protein [Halpernia frigidisoli]SFI06448.1 undecaprenyl-diphosphatase [Halpernia frigidisoli]